MPKKSCHTCVAPRPQEDLFVSGGNVTCVTCQDFLESFPLFAILKFCTPDSGAYFGWLWFCFSGVHLGWILFCFSGALIAAAAAAAAAEVAAAV